MVQVLTVVTEEQAFAGPASIADQVQVADAGALIDLRVVTETNKRPHKVGVLIDLLACWNTADALVTVVDTAWVPVVLSNLEALHVVISLRFNNEAAGVLVGIERNADLLLRNVGRDVTLAHTVGCGRARGDLVETLVTLGALLARDAVTPELTVRTVLLA